MSKILKNKIRFTWGVLAIFLISVLLSSCGSDTPTTNSNTATTPTPGQVKLTTVPATITTNAGQNIQMVVEIARTAQEQETGLMNRASVPDGTGMLFVFSQPGNVNFWMKDTKIPLSIAFIDSNGKILDVQDMQAESEELHSPGQNYQYALEVGLGWFGKVKVKAGDIIKFQL